MTKEEALEQKTISQAKSEMYKAQLQELKVLEARKDLVDTASVVSLIRETFSNLKTNLYSVSHNVPAQIVGKDHSEVTDILYAFIDTSLERFGNEFKQKLSNMKVSDVEELEEVIEEENISE